MTIANLILRAYALQRHRPLSLQATISLPTAADDPSDTQAHLLDGFIHLVGLYRPFDDSLVALWNKTRSDCTPSYLAALQKQLADMLPTYLNSTENQTADLRISQQWLRTMIWQLSIQNGCLSSNSEDPSMTFQYPVDISRDLLALTSQFPKHTMEVHGISLVEKLFDVACSLTDVLSLLPSNPDPFTLGPRDYLHQFVTLLSALRNGDTRFLPLLLSKVHDVLPSLVNPMLQTVPDTPMCSDVDIFDGFGNAGMGIPSGSYAGNHSSTVPAFKIDIPGPGPFNKRIEELSSPSIESAHDNTPFTPATVNSSMEFPGIAEYTGYQEMNANNLNPNYEGARQQEYIKREFDHSPMGHPGMNHGHPQNQNHGIIRSPLVRQGSHSSGFPQIPGNMAVPEPYQHLHRTNSHGHDDRGMVNVALAGGNEMGYQ